MQLKSFRVRNFRSINDSGLIDASRITAFLGRNESGKSNLLKALHSLNPAEGFAALKPIKDFPRHRRLAECSDDTPVVDSNWGLNGTEQAELAEIWPSAAGVTEVRIARRYQGGLRFVGIDVPDRHFDASEIRAATRKIVAAIKAGASSLEEGQKAALETAADKFASEIGSQTEPSAWATKAVLTLSALRQALAVAGVDLSDSHDQLIVTLEDLAEAIPGDETQHTAARSWVISKIPVFIYLDDYPAIEGHQDISAYLQRQKSKNLTAADINFGKLCKVAGLDAKQLQSLLESEDPETRSQLVNRAGAVVTTAIRQKWHDRKLKIRFNLDSNHFDTLISDPNSTYDVEVNLDERSRGFQWFFAFYIVFAADTDEGDADNAIILLDEPGLYLHAKSQGDLLRHLKDDFNNQILYTTHSPFMVPTNQLDSVRTVNISEDSGTTVSNDPTGDSRTLFPLQAALGYDLAQSLFVGPNNLIVEGVTDFWILSAVSEYLNAKSKSGLHKDLTITPAGGAQKVHYMVALLTSENINVIVLLDDEKDARVTRDDLVKSKLIRDDYVLFTDAAFAEGLQPKESDIEDLLDPTVFINLVTEGYAKELKTKRLKLNENIPRIAKRYEIAFQEVGLEFYKSRASRLFLQKMSNDPESVLTTDSIDRFENLFSSINSAFQKKLNRM